MNFDEIEVRKLKVTNPIGQCISISILNRIKASSILSKKKFVVKCYYLMAMQKREVYELEDKTILINYTDKNYMVKVKSYEEAKEILNNELFGTILIHESNGKMYYCFDVYSKYFTEFNIPALPKFNKQYNGSFYFKGEEKQYITVYKNSSIIHYFERAKNVYQGTWYPNKCNIEYFKHFDEVEP